MQNAVYMLHVKEATVAWSVLTQVFWDVFVGVCVCDQRWLPARQAVITVACHLNVALCMVVYIRATVMFGRVKDGLA